MLNNMVEFYDFMMKSNSRSVIEICTTDPRGYAFVKPFLLPISKIKLPNEASFRVVRGKSWTDIIVYHQGASIRFYSQRIINLLGRFLDMSDKCYPIRIEGSEQVYYVIYNLKEYVYLNQRYSSVLGKAPYFELSDSCAPLFTLTNSNITACTKIVKEALIKEKITNIQYGELYGLTKEEKAIYEATEAIDDKVAYDAL